MMVQKDIGQMKMRSERQTAKHLAFSGMSALALAGWSLPAFAQAVTPTTREEIQRDRLETQLRTEGQSVAVEGDIERAPCPLAAPQFADLKFTLSAAQFTGLDAIDGSVVAPSYTGLIGQELPVAAICDIRDRAATILRAQGYLAAVQVPAQEIEGGAVRFDVVLARMTAVQVRGDAGKSGQQVQKYIDRLVDQPVFNVHEAARYLLLARDIPGLDVRLVLQPATGGDGSVQRQPGEVVGIFNVTNTPVTADANIQNLGSRSVGRFGGLLRAQFNGLTGLGDQTTLSFYTTSDFKEQRVVQAGHEFRLGSEGLTLGGDFAYAWSTPGIAGPDLFESETLIGSIYASYPFKRGQTSNLIGTFGADLVNQDIEFSGLPLSQDRLRIAYGRLDFNMVDEPSLRGVDGYSGFEPRWAIAGSAEIRQGFDLLGASEPCGAAFVNCTAVGVIPLSRLDGDPSALVVRGQAQLDYRPTPLLALSVKPRFQYSPDALLSFEQISGGNYTSGRGFDPGAVIGDSGYGGQLEIAYGSLVPKTPGGYAVQPYGFFDVMAVSNKNVPGDPQTITSAGGGVRATLGRYGYLDIYGAVPLERSPLQTQRGDTRILMTLTMQLAPWGR